MMKTALTRITVGGGEVWVEMGVVVNIGRKQFSVSNRQALKREKGRKKI